MNRCLPEKQYALLGYPLTKSLSPVIHKLFAKQFNLDIEYQALEVAPIDLILTINNRIDAGFNGFNITALYKEIIFQQLQNYDSNVRISRVDPVLLATTSRSWSSRRAIIGGFLLGNFLF